VGLPSEQVIVHAMRLGGGFGGREMYEVERDALRLASSVDRPVKVQWSRADEFRAAKNRPPSSHRVRLRAGADGRLTDWWHALMSGHIVFSKARMPGWLRAAAGMFVADLGVARGAKPPYDAPRKRVEIGDVELPIDLGTWRSLGAAPNTFVIESAVDELARLRGVDPVDFRLSHLQAEHGRLSTCLRKVRELADRVPLPVAPGHGRGFACGIYEERSFVAAGADVHVNPDSGQISVLRMCCAQDVGLAINPDQLRAQIEGNMIWGIGMALMEELAIGSGEIATRNLDTYRIPRMGDAPSFEIEIIDAPSERPAAAGETALIVAPPAIANAVRDATGRRLTMLPLQLGSRSPSTVRDGSPGSARRSGGTGRARR
jgi:CO/xanthine dehydrogenase Mo-binding subunit